MKVRLITAKNPMTPFYEIDDKFKELFSSTTRTIVRLNQINSDILGQLQVEGVQCSGDDWLVVDPATE